LSQVQNQEQCHKTENNCRYKPIDTFRGFSILAMVFFTVTLRLSRDLPDILRHNVWGSLHVGDFVLPFFLFSSGLSLAFYISKNEQLKDFFQNVTKRFIKLAFVGILLSYFSAYGFFEMDEVMLCAFCFIICILINRFDYRINLCLILTINLSYLLLLYLKIQDIFIEHYLGGYPAIVYYLPVMLVGLLLGNGIISDGLYCKKNNIIISTIFVFFLIFWFLIPIHKLTVTPSFIMLSIIVSYLIFVFIEMILKVVKSSKELDYIGKKPLRYWIMMYIFFLIPLKLYTVTVNLKIPLEINWTIAIVISFILMICLWGLSHIIDYLYFEKKEIKIF